MMTKPLTVYKASAGSGKTFTLASEFIKLLVVNPMNYRAILAVTFTNKATEEMKMRILSQLYGIWKQLPDSESYARKVETETGLSREMVVKRSGQALHLLIHNYNQFRVQTIDAFFQNVLRNLARELNLTANLQVGLNGIQVEELAVDILIDNLRTSDIMLQWLLDYVMQAIQDDKGWSNSSERGNNLLADIKKFGHNIFNDGYKSHREAINALVLQEGFFEHYVTKLQDFRNNAVNTMKTIAASFFDKLEEENLTVEDLSRGQRGIASFFKKLMNGVFDESVITNTVTKMLEDPGAWCKKTHKRVEEIKMLAEKELIPILRFAVDERPTHWKAYSSSQLTLRHLSNLRLLNSIEQMVRYLNEESNTFLLSDTQHLLHALIGDSDSPFIFEKMGAQLDHIMIDEFQDTSTIQWENFRILLKECMSHEGSHNLIVGDVKQSIYRWRSGDWKLLNNIDEQFHDYELDVESLQTNYRSERGIITFNNAFFTAVANMECENLQRQNVASASQVSQAYADVCQQVPDNRPSTGYVEVRLLNSKDYASQMFDGMIERIGSLLEEGVHPSDIAILVRGNNVIPQIADLISSHYPEVSVVSNEAFRLDASPSLQIIVNALSLLLRPDDKLVKAQLVKSYQKLVAHPDTWNDGQQLLLTVDPDTLLPDEFIHHMDELRLCPLFELVERLYKIFSLDRLDDQSAYVSTFYDCLSTFTRDNSTGISEFLELWNQKLHEQTIQSDQVEGIRIMTIHKSKGLEFDHVIMPCCDWQMEKSNTIWCSPQEETYKELPVTLIDYSKKGMMGSIYENDYLEEHLQLTVDNLNLLYVAFTRASKTLFVTAKQGTETTRSFALGNALPLVANQLEDCHYEANPDTGETLFQYGEWHMEPSRQQTKTSANVFLQPSSPISIAIQPYHRSTEFRQSNKSLEFIDCDGEADEQQNYIKTGSVLHYVFSKIRTAADVDRVLLELEQEGVIYDSQLTVDRLKDMLHKRLATPQVKEWFSDRWQVYNECAILSRDSEGHTQTRRPDRVVTDGNRIIVIDFKFGRPKPEYQQQVKEYIDLLEQMSNQQVEGYLWYVYTNKIDPVE